MSETTINQIASPTLVIEPSGGLFHLELADIWRHRELLYFLVWRDLKIRYKQTAIGVSWAVLQPLLQMLIFTVVFSNFARVPSEGAPYPLIALAALLPWNFFATALNRSIQSVVGDAQLISKVYFPRLIMPISGVLSGIVDCALGFILLLILMLFYGVTPTVAIWTLPIFLMAAMLTALAMGLWLSALNVKYRDVGQAIPFLIQIWMWASPVAYQLGLVPKKWQLLYSLNPLVGVLEGFRWALLATPHPQFSLLALSMGVVVLIFVGGVLYFNKMQESFADVI